MCGKPESEQAEGGSGSGSVSRAEGVSSFYMSDVRGVFAPLPHGASRERPESERAEGQSGPGVWSRREGAEATGIKNVIGGSAGSEGR